MTDAVPGFDVTTFTHGGRTHEVYRAGAGSAVVVVHEMPGLHPGVTKFGQRLVDAGYRVYLPSLFGRPGAPFGGSEMRRALRQVCVSREFVLLADRTQPGGDVAAGARRAGARGVRRARGGRGGHVLHRRVRPGHGGEPAVLAPVLSQPGLPAPLTARKRAALGLDPADLASVKARTSDGLCVLGLRFSADRGSPPERFATLRAELGENFEAIEIDSSPGNQYGIRKRAHSVLTEDLVDTPGHPTRAALDRVMAFFAERLQP